MIQQNTAFILGAGTSVEYGFPLGRGLLAGVVESLDDPSTQVFLSLRELGHPEAEIRQFRKNLMRSMSQSIDSFLEKRREFTKIGKAAIAATLIPYERPEWLYQPRDVPTWLEILLPHIGLSPGITTAPKVRFITFNYDRSLTQCLYVYLRNAFSLSHGPAVAILRHFQPIHVYGKLGELDYYDPAGRSYAPTINSQTVKRAAEGIQVIFEGGRSDALDEARAWIQDASLIMFLGFGFHPENVARLQIPANGNGRLVCGSAFGLGHGERLLARSHFTDGIYLGPGSQNAATYLRESPFLAWASGVGIQLPPQLT